MQAQIKKIRNSHFKIKGIYNTDAYFYELQQALMELHEINMAIM